MDNNITGCLSSRKTGPATRVVYYYCYLPLWTVVRNPYNKRRNVGFFFIIILLRKETPPPAADVVMYRKLNYKNPEAANLTGNSNRCIRKNKILSGPTGTTIVYNGDVFILLLKRPFHTVFYWSFHSLDTTDIFFFLMTLTHRVL